MKNLRNLLIIFCLAAVLISCGKDDPEPQLKDVEFGLFNQTMAVPQELMSSESEYAQELYFKIAEVNPVAYSAMFTVPSGATKMEGTITAANSRAYSNVSTYVWNSQEGSIAYQITEQADGYFYEIFIKHSSEGEYYKWFEGTQSKDKKSGTFLVLDAFADARAVDISYKYEIKSDNSLYVEYVTPFYDAILVFNSDKSGSLKEYDGEALIASYTWTNSGSGTWTLYESGVEASSGSW